MQHLGVGIAKCYVLLSSSSARAASIHVFRNTGSHCADARLLEFPKKAAGGSSGASRVPKRFRISHMSSVYQATNKNRG